MSSSSSRAKKKVKRKNNNEISDKSIPNTKETATIIDDLFSSTGKALATSDGSNSGTKRLADSNTASTSSKRRKAEIDEEEEDLEPDAFGARTSYGLIKSRYRSAKVVNPEAPVERIDPESGFKVYKAHLLRVGEGGGTNLCPFDCNCCF